MFGMVEESLSIALLMLAFLRGEATMLSSTELLFLGTGVGSMLYLRPVLLSFDVGGDCKLSFRIGNVEAVAQY